MDEINGPGYLDSAEASRLDETFSSTLIDEKCLVFWTGVTSHLAMEWARGNNLKTLAMSMGALYSDNGPKSLRYLKSSKTWRKYMKGASNIYAQHARRKQKAIVITNPPPDVYSKRPKSSYREIEEPILKEMRDGCCATRICYVHPMVPGAESFQYQIWPDDHSTEWFTFLTFIAARPLVNTVGDRTENTNKTHIYIVAATKGLASSPSIRKNTDDAKDKKVLRRTGKRSFVQRVLDSSTLKGLTGSGNTDERAQTQKVSRKEKAALEQQQAHERKAANKRKAALQQRRAQARKLSNKEKAALQQQQAQERKMANKQKATLAQRQAQARKAARAQTAALERRQAQERKAVKQQEAALERQKAQEQKAAREQEKRARRQIETELRKLAKAWKAELSRREKLGGENELNRALEWDGEKMEFLGERERR